MVHKTRIHFLRHGEAENPCGIYYGRLPGFPLSQRGIRQARAASACLRDARLGAIYSSPLTRTRETAQWVAREHPDLCVEISDLLTESATPFEGLPFVKMQALDLDAYDPAAIAVAPGARPAASFEQPGAILQRMLRFVGDALGKHPGSEIAAVTHGDPLAFLMLWAKRLPLGRDERLALYREELLARGSITTFTFSDSNREDPPRIEYLRPEIAAD